MSKPELVVDYCSHEAAKFAVMHWHYSKSMPSGKLVKFGVWEDGRFIGAVLFGRGGNNNIGSRYGLEQTQVCELVRVALTDHQAQVSQIVSAVVRKLKETNAGMRLLVSYADPVQQHTGVIYQAMNWIYVGTSPADTRLKLSDGTLLHSRQFSSSGYNTQFGVRRRVPTPEDGELVKIPGKHKYLYPLDRKMRRQLLPLAQPYPKPDGAAQSSEISES